MTCSDLVVPGAVDEPAQPNRKEGVGGRKTEGFYGVEVGDANAVQCVVQRDVRGRSEVRVSNALLACASSVGET